MVHARFKFLSRMKRQAAASKRLSLSDRLKHAGDASAELRSHLRREQEALTEVRAKIDQSADELALARIELKADEMNQGLAGLPTHQRITHILAEITLKQKKLDEDASHFLRLCKGAGSYMLEERILQGVCVHSPTPYKPMIAVRAERLGGDGGRSAPTTWRQ